MNDQRGYPTPKSSQNSGDRRDRDSGKRHGVYGRGGEDWRDTEDNNHYNDRIRGDEQGWRCMEVNLFGYRMQRISCFFLPESIIYDICSDL